jgi:hypothetical protein
MGGWNPCYVYKVVSGRRFLGRERENENLVDILTVHLLDAFLHGFLYFYILSCRPKEDKQITVSHGEICIRDTQQFDKHLAIDYTVISWKLTDPIELYNARHEIHTFGQFRYLAVYLQSATCLVSMTAATEGIDRRQVKT